MRNRLYYVLKPFLPWALRMRMRRSLAQSILNHGRTPWPILPSAARTPDSWKGWPSPHRWAFVLTHDIEGPDGLARVRRLAELELELGFRSAFNFIPEGTYTVPPELLQWLRDHGFEVGVHDLAHDGTLYRSRAGFRERAQRINRYLKEWNAVGFRSGFMHHNLDWIHDLELEYDASTFDHDPFEPQPDGAGTIFPFWVEAPPPEHPSSTLASPRRGYVELPYTLPQDSTLYLLLQETSPQTWLRKLDWIIRHGGMALVNVHPDYLQFPDEPASPRTFPIQHYRALLERVRASTDAPWTPCPRDLARWYVQTHVECGRNPNPDPGPEKCPNAGPNTAPIASEPKTPEPNRDSTKSPPDAGCLQGRRVGVLLYSVYPADSRPRRAAEAFAAAGAAVDLICLQESPRRPWSELIQGVQVLRVPLRQRRGGHWTYAFQYGTFWLWSFLLLTARSWKRPFDLIHAHNMPDFLVLAAWRARQRGARILLDLHDPMPELFMSLFRKSADHPLIRLLCWMERVCIRFADLVLTPNEAFRQRFVSRSGAYGKIQVIVNTPEEHLFPGRDVPAAPAAPPDTFRLMYHGLIAERHGLDLAVAALALLLPHIPNLRLDLFGQPNAYLDEVLKQAETLGVRHCIHVHGFVSEAEIARQIQDCDLGIIPNRYSPFIALNLPTRIFEYLALGRPVVVPNTPGIRDYFGAEDLIYFSGDSSQSLAEAIRWAYQHPGLLTQLTRRGQAVYRRHQWQSERRRLLDWVAELLGNGGMAAASVAKT